MTELHALSEKIGRLFHDLAKAFSRFIQLCKYGAVLGAFFIAFATFALTPVKDWTLWNYIGVAGALIVFFAALGLILTETNTAAALESARSALAKAQAETTAAAIQVRQSNEIEKVYTTEIDRLSQLQAGRDLIRVILEDLLGSGKKQTDEEVITRILNQSQRSLLLAHGFVLKEHYSICVFKASLDADGKRSTLRCVAHLRSIMCDLSEARPWKEGVGVGGAAFARASEIVVPDLTAVQLGSFCEVPEKKKDDDTRYRSIVAEPIILGSDPTPWGVVTATTSVAGHFGLKDRRYVDVTHSLAGILALAIKVNRAKIP